MKTENSTNKIHLIGNYYYTADDNQYILLECGSRKKIDRKTRKVTDEIMDYEDQLGYYTTLSAMIKACITHANRTATANGDFDNLTDAIKHIDKMFSDIDDKILI